MSSKTLPKAVARDGAKWIILPAKVMLDILSLWPETRTIRRAVLGLLCFISMLFVILGQIHHLCASELDLATAAFVFTLFIASIESISRQVLLAYNRKKIVKLLNTVYYEFWSSNVADKGTENNLFKFSWFIVIYCTTYTISAFLCVQQLLMMPLITANGNLPLLSTYPFAWWKSPLYEIMYVWHTCVAEALIFIICGVDLFFVGLLWNCIVQFILLRTFIQNNYKKGLAGMETLRKCIIHHNMLIQACKDLENTFTYFILLLFLTSIGTICISSFVVTVVPQETGTAATYFVGHISQLFIYCYLGTLLIYESTALSDAVFHCGWHFSELTPESKSALVMLMLRSQNKQHLTAGGFAVVDLTSFAQVVKLSFSVYTLLNSMMERAQR